MFGEVVIAETRRALRVLETAGAPTFYIPRVDARTEHLEPSQRHSWCEWKGRAAYWSLHMSGTVLEGVAWSYPDPFPGYEALVDHYSFYPSRLTCTVDGERVRPQPGGFYGGWVTDELVGPIKGEPGSEDW